MSTLAAWLCGNDAGRDDRFRGPTDYTLTFGSEPDPPPPSLEQVCASWGVDAAPVARSWGDMCAANAEARRRSGKYASLSIRSTPFLPVP